MMDMSKRTIGILAGLYVLVFFGAVSGSVYIYRHTLQPDRAAQEYSNPGLSKVDNVAGKPIQDIIVSRGRGGKSKAISGELLAKITNPATITSLGASITPLVGIPDNYKIKTPAGDLVKAASELRKKPGVVWAQPNYVVTGSATPVYPKDPQLKYQDYLSQISAPESWSLSTGGAAVAVVDSGIDLSHPDLSSQILHNGGEIDGDGIDNDGNGYADDYYGANVFGANGNVSDDAGHGTSVAGTIGAQTNNGVGVAGVSYGAPILPVKVLDANAAGSEDTVAMGIYYVIRYNQKPGTTKIRVINLSLNTGSCNGTCYALPDAINAALSSGIVVVVSSGNNGAGVARPANLPGVIAVGGSDTGNPDSVRSDSQANTGPELTLVAPMETYTTTLGSSYGEFAGTSAAAPVVSGVVASMLNANPNLSPARVKSLLMQTADKSAGSNNVGAGRVNAFQAIQAAINCR